MISVKDTFKTFAENYKTMNKDVMCPFADVRSNRLGGKLKKTFLPTYNFSRLSPQVEDRATRTEGSRIPEVLKTPEHRPVFGSWQPARIAHRAEERLDNAF